jgi:hypothetical protein
VLNSPPPRGAKIFEEAAFATGELLLPPLSYKQREQAQNSYEIFQVLESDGNSVVIEYTDSDQRFAVGAGKMIQVPPNTMYSLFNRSKTKAAKLTFTIIRDDPKRMEVARESGRAESRQKVRDQILQRYREYQQASSNLAFPEWLAEQERAASADL